MAELTVPQVDFSGLGELPNVYRAGQVANARQRTLAELGQGADLTDTSRKLFQSGDVQGGLSLANLANAVEQQKFNRDQAMFQRGITERQVGLAEKQAEEKPQYQVLEDASGNKRLIKIDPFGKGFSDVTPGGNSAPTNPYSPGKQTEAQSKDSLYASRMANAEKILRDPSVTSAATSTWERVGGAIGDKMPFGAGRAFMSEGYQKFDQAKRDFINAVLRRESGAAIAPSEFDNAEKQYFPAPGDSKELLLQKQRNRVEAIKGVSGGAGPAYRPPFTFGANDEMMPNEPAQAPAATAAPAKLPTGYTPQKAIAEAKAAIAAGKDPKAIAARLQQLGIDPSGL